MVGELEIICIVWQRYILLPHKSIRAAQSGRPCALYATIWDFHTHTNVFPWPKPVL